MTHIAIIIFREILEIALILSILFSSTIGIKNRSLWINAGLVIGVIGSIIIATLTDKISEAFHGVGQEIFNAIILLFAALMIGYTVIWMKQHSKAMSKTLKHLGKSVIDGEKSLYALLIIVSLSVLREGAEIVLFTYSYYSSGTPIHELIIGSSMGFAVGLVVGLGFYFGILRKLGTHLFQVTTPILVFLSAGLVAKSLGYLSSAGVISEIKTQMWDTSFLISENSIVGNVLNILFGYISRPSGIQLIGYLSTIIILFGLIKKLNGSTPNKK